MSKKIKNIIVKDGKVYRRYHRGIFHDAGKPRNDDGTLKGKELTGWDTRKDRVYHVVLQHVRKANPKDVKRYVVESKFFLEGPVNKGNVLDKPEVYRNHRAESLPTAPVGTVLGD